MGVCQKKSDYNPQNLAILEYIKQGRGGVSLYIYETDKVLKKFSYTDLFEALSYLNKQNPIYPQNTSRYGGEWIIYIYLALYIIPF